MLGDVDGSGTINIVDALIVAQYYVGLNPAGFNPAYADVDGNGTINIVDALLIARYYVGLITEFPAGGPTEPPSGGSEPKASFTISNVTPGLNEIVQFDGSGSSDPDGTIVSYHWDFKDGTEADGVRVSHAFIEIDDYNVVLTVTDDSGLSDDKKNRVMVGRPAGWTEDTHHKSADGDYETVFPEDSVNRMDITISPADFETMERNLDTLNIMSTENPVYVPATINFNGLTWWHVGVRYKGQSTLFIPKQEGKHKYPFHINFDKLEDDYPEIDDQRFYGFKELLVSNNWFDSSLLRDKVCADILRDGGTPTARGSYWRIYVDTGSGLNYWGLYTMFEDPSDLLLETQFTNPDGNLYKSDGQGGDFRTFTETAFTKKTNEDEADFSDIRSMIDSLNAPRNNAASWRAGLEATFDTHLFMRWLAVNTSIVNWDTYGWVTKNYYLYQDLDDNGRLKWIPWDFNLSLSESNPFNINIPIPSLSLDEVSTNWPLITFLMDDQVYRDLYHQEMAAALDGCFNETAVKNKINRLHNLIRPYVVGAEGERNGYTYLTNGASEFDQALTELLNHITSRRQKVASYLLSPSATPPPEGSRPANPTMPFPPSP